MGKRIIKELPLSIYMHTSTPVHINGQTWMLYAGQVYSLPKDEVKFLLDQGKAEKHLEKTKRKK